MSTYRTFVYLDKIIYHCVLTNYMHMIYKFQSGKQLPSLESIKKLPKRRSVQEQQGIAAREQTEKWTKEQINKAKNTKTWRSKAADKLHTAGVGLTGVGLVGSFAMAPAATALGMVGGIAGEKAVDKASKKITGRTWNENMQKYLGLGPTLSSMLNPGGWIGGGLGVKASAYKPKPGYLGMNGGPSIKVPDGYSFVREVTLNGKTKHVVKDPNGKFKVLEDLDFTQKPAVDLSKYNGEPLTGNEPGFDAWASRRTPENDHFPDLSHGLEDIRELLPIINREFESLPNGSRIALGETFSGDISSNLLQFVRRNNKRIKMIIPNNPDHTVRTNDHGIKGAISADNFNTQLDKLLDLYGYAPDAVQHAAYDINTNTLSVPGLSFIKLHKRGGRLWN